MASLANQTISSTYDGLIKTSTDDAVPVSGVQLLEDGSGNSLAISIGRANNGVTVTGTVTATAFVGDGSGLTGISVSPTLDEVTTNGATTTNSITVGNITASSFIKSGGTSAQFLKADGSVDSSTYLTSFTETNDLTAAVVWANVPDANITQTSVTQHQAALSITESQISDLQPYLTAESDTLDSVTGRGATTTNAITVGGISITGTLLDSNGQAGTSGQILSSTATGIDWVDPAAGGGDVTSVNGQTGVVVLDADDIDDTSTTNKFTTAGDISKLAGIEALADVTDVTNVTTAINSISVTEHSDVTNAGSGAIITTAERDKLAGIEALADVTDATNVAAAGALMSGTAALSDLVDVSSATPADGQVLTYDTVNGWQPEDSAGGGIDYTVQEISTNTTAVKDNLYVFTASLTLTLPASPSVGDKVGVANMSGTTTPVIARNGSLLIGLAEDLTIDVENIAVEFIYSGATEGWIMFADAIYGSAATSGGGVAGTGTANYLSKWSDSTTLTDSVIYESSGNIGIGTSSPIEKFVVSNGGAYGLEINPYEGNDNVRLMAIDRTTLSRVPMSFDASEFIFQINTVTERMRIDASGKVGIGTTAPATTLHIYSGTANEAVRIESSDTAVILELKDSVGTSKIESRGDFRFSTNSGEKMRLLDTGELYIAGTADRGSYNLQCNGTGVWGQGAYVNGSDIRFKEQIKPIESGLDVIEKLKPVSYKYKEEFSRDTTTQAGFIAQDLQEALEGKEYLDGIVKSDSEYLSVAYQSLIPILTKAIQELKSEIETLKSQING